MAAILRLRFEGSVLALIWDSWAGASLGFVFSNIRVGDE